MRGVAVTLYRGSWDTALVRCRRPAPQACRPDLVTGHRDDGILNINHFLFLA
jgi:hypothetical protein